MGMMVSSSRIKTNPPIGRSVVSVLAHVALLSFSLLAAFVLAYNFSRTEQWFFPQFMMALPVFLLVKYLAFTLTHQYQRSWRYVGYSDVSSIVLACAAAAGAVYGLLLLFRAGAGGSALGRIADFPASVLWIDFILSVALVVGAR